MRFVQHRRRERRKEVNVKVVDFRRALDAVCRVAVGGYIERLVGVLRIIEVVRDTQLIGLGYVEISLQQKSIVSDRMLYRQTFVLIPRSLNKINQRQSLAVGAGID